MIEIAAKLQYPNFPLLPGLLSQIKASRLSLRAVNLYIQSLSDLIAICCKCPDLVRLELGNLMDEVDSQASDRCLANIFDTCIELKYIRLDGFPLRRTMLRGFSGLPNLKCLRLVNSSLTDEKLRIVAASVPNLERLDIWTNEHVTILGIQALATGLRRLKFLDLCCTSLEEEGMSQVFRKPSNFPQLQALWTPFKASKEFVESIQQSRPFCTVDFCGFWDGEAS